LSVGGLLARLAARRGILLALTAAISVVALGGLTRLGFDDDVRRIFSPSDPELRALQQRADEFGTDELDLFVLLEGPDLLAWNKRSALRRAATGLATVPGVASVLSPLALPDPDGDGVLDADEITRHPLGRHLVSRDAGAMLLPTRLSASLATVDDLEPVLDRARETVEEALAGTGIGVRLTGQPALRVAVVRGVQRDQIRFNVIGLLAAVLVGILLFRRWSAVAIVGAAPAVAVVWTLGALGWADIPIDVLTNVVPQLVLVIAFADAVHVVIAFRRHSDGSPLEASRAALRDVGAACALTSWTTMTGFGSLAFVGMDALRGFGVACAIGTGLGFLAVVTVTPLLLGSRLGAHVHADSGRRDPVESAISRWTDPLLGHPLIVVIGGGAILAALVVAGTRLVPDYRYRDFLPAGAESVRALDRIDRDLGGSLPVQAVVEWSDDETPESSVLEMIGRTERALEASPLLGEAVSARDVLAALPFGETGLATLRRLPPELTRPWILPDRRLALVTARAGDVGAARLAPALDAVDARLEDAVANRPGVRIELVGTTVASSRASLAMIETLARSLALAGAVIFVTLVVAFRSVRLGIASLAPNALPLLAVVAWLVAADRPLQFTSVTVLVVALGIAVDDTIHVLSAFRRLRDGGEDPVRAARGAVRQVGPAVVVTTALLVAGFGTLLTSALPNVRLFGGLACLAFVVALIGDLLLLPSLLSMVPDRRSRDTRGHPAPSEPDEGVAPERQARAAT